MNHLSFCLLLLLLTPLQMFSQEGNLKANDCWGGTEIILANSEVAKKLFERHNMNLKWTNEISIVLDDETYEFRGEEYDDLDEMLDQIDLLFREQEYSSWGLSIGLAAEAPIKYLYWIGCALEDYSNEFGEIILYTF